MTAKDDVATVVAELVKAKDEILAKINNLQTAVDNGTVTAADLDPLREAAQALDDIVPDVTAPAEPVVESPAETPVETPVDEPPVEL